MPSVKRTQPQPDPAATPGDGARPAISERVLAYFRRNSEAMDSVEGIARFWVRENRSVVERALNGLHDDGLLDRRLIGGAAVYSPNPGASLPPPPPPPPPP